MSKEKIAYHNIPYDHGAIASDRPAWQREMYGGFFWEAFLQASRSH